MEVGKGSVREGWAGCGNLRLQGPRAPLEPLRDPCALCPGQSFSHPYPSSQLMRIQGPLSGKERFPFLSN